MATSNIAEINDTADPIQKKITYEVSDRLLWRSLLLQRYYNDLGSSDKLDVVWGDFNDKSRPILISNEDPKQLMNKIGRKTLFKTIIQINLIDSTKLMTITMYYTTDTIMIQGHASQTWVTKEYKCLLECIRLMRNSPNCLPALPVNDLPVSDGTIVTASPDSLTSPIPGTLDPVISLPNDSSTPLANHPLPYLDINNGRILQEDESSGSSDNSDEDGDLISRRRRCLSIVDEFNKEIEGGKKQMGLYINQIEKITLEKQELEKNYNTIQGDIATLIEERNQEKLMMRNKEDEIKQLKLQNNQLRAEIKELKNQKEVPRPDADILARLSQLERKQEAMENNSKKLENNMIEKLKIVTKASETLFKRCDENKKNVSKVQEHHNNLEKQKVKGGSVWEGASRGSIMLEGSATGGRSDKWVDVVGKKKRGKPRGGTLKIKLYADSHGRDMVDKLNGAQVSVKGGAKMEGVLGDAGNAGADVCTVVMGGTNDVSIEGVRRGLDKLKNKMGNGKKLVVVGVPNRHDRDAEHMIGMINHKNDVIKNFCYFYGYKYLNIDDSKREYFTKHGLHFNKRGKLWLADKIKSAANSFLV